MCVAAWWAASRRRLARRSRSLGRRSLRPFASLGTEQTDEQVADETLDGDERLGRPDDTARWLRAHGQYSALLDAAETSGADGARRWLALHLPTWDASPPPRMCREANRLA